jgi:hypothetical protein
VAGMAAGLKERVAAQDRLPAEERPVG